MSALAKNRNWGDDEEDEEQKLLQGETNGVVERVKISTNAKGQKVKTITKIRVKQIRTKMPLRCVDRRNLPRFGDAKIGEENVTLNSKDFVKFEHPEDAMNEVEDDTAKKTLQNFIQKQAESKYARENDLEINKDFDRSEPSFGNEESSGAGGGNRYVPPGARSGGDYAGSSGPGHGKSGGADGTENTLRVSNLTKAVTEDDLRALFERFGRIHRISLPRVERVENGVTVKEPRGFAYIAFQHRDDAQEALDRLQGHGYDHLILKLEWAQPNKSSGGGAGSSGVGSQYMSGYGTALAQDTKEKVLYASNLTGNR